jgi:tRNA-dihydrouridine synthase
MGSPIRAQESGTLQQKQRDEHGEDHQTVSFSSPTTKNESSSSSGSSREEQNCHRKSADTQDKDDENENDNDNTGNKDGEATMVIMMAPMVRGSELAFRMMARQGSGISLCYSPMLRAKEVVKAYKYWKEKEELNDRTTKDEPLENEDTNESDDNSPGSAFPMAHSQAASSSRSPPSLLSTMLSKLHEDGVLFLTDTCPEDRPLVVQLCGCCPMTLYQATQAVLERYFQNCTTTTATHLGKQSTSGVVEVEDEEEGWNGIDLNLGCPQSCARDDKFGAFLVDSDPDLAIQCVAAMRRAIDDYYKDPPGVSFVESNPLLGLPTTTATTTTTSTKTTKPKLMSLSGIDSSIASSTRSQKRVNRRRPRLSCKMRLLDTVEDTIAFAKRLEGAGCDLLAIHCRHRVVKHDGIPDQAAGQALVQALSIPVILNGTIQTLADISKTVHHGTRGGVAGVMIGRALLQNPYLYQKSNSTTSIKSTCPALLAADYLDFAERYPPPSVLFLQKHLRWIFRATLQPPPPSAAVAAELLLQSPPSLPRRERKNKENVLLKECYSNWRHRIWTFLVQPYLETIDQFRRVVVLYLVLHHGDGDAHLGQTKLLTLSSSPSANMTISPSLMKFIESSSDPPSFHSIRHNSMQAEQQWKEEEEAEGFLSDQHIFG